MGARRVTTLHVHRVPRRHVPSALWRMAVDRRCLRDTPGLVFSKLLGTGDGRTFDIRDADVRTWALLAVWHDAGALAAFEQRSPVAAAWRRLAVERWRVDLRLLAARGRWSGVEPFGAPTEGGAGPVAALTRARVRAGHVLAFHRAVPRVVADLRGRPGLRFAMGIGEAPVGLLGTFSIWSSAAALRSFAYEGPAHRAVIRQTHETGWYAEELFARFAVTRTVGSITGVDALTSPECSFSS